MNSSSSIPDERWLANLTVTMSHDQYDDEDDYQDGGYPNPEQAYDEPNGFEDSYDDRNTPNDADDYDPNAYGSRDYDDPSQDAYPDEAPMNEPAMDDLDSPDLDNPDLDNPDLDADFGGDPRHVSQIYQDEAGDITDHDPITEYLKSKDPDWDVQPPETKNLLDLPEDILRLVVKEASTPQSSVRHLPSGPAPLVGCLYLLCRQLRASRVMLTAGNRRSRIPTT